MKIGVVGLGLIGGSLLKAIKNNTDFICYGYDTNEKIVSKAKLENSIDFELNENNTKDMDIIFICLYPIDTVKYIKNDINIFRKDCIVVDVCGIKEYVEKNVAKLLFDNGMNYLGVHPMAGKEVSGYENSSEDLFVNANFIITKTCYTTESTIDTIKQLARKIGFNRVVVCSAKEHDNIIAFTSQLAHIVSSAYVKSPTIKEQPGFSAGSFQDLTRVAKLNPKMWKELFILNKKPLIKELDNIINNLRNYKIALKNNDEGFLEKLLSESSKIKIQNIEDNKTNK